MNNNFKVPSEFRKQKADLVAAYNLSRDKLIAKFKKEHPELIETHNQRVEALQAQRRRDIDSINASFQDAYSNLLDEYTINGGEELDKHRKELQELWTAFDNAKNMLYDKWNYHPELAKKSKACL